MTYVNNCLNLACGLSSGNIVLLSAKTLQTLAVVNKAQVPVGSDGVHCMIELLAPSSEGESLPFIGSCGADGTVKLLEHNLYKS